MSAPPLLSNVGKSSADFFKKKFELEPITVKNIRKAANGITVESGAVSVAANAEKKVEAHLRGYQKFTLGKQSWGSGELEIHTDKDQTSKISAKFTNLYNGLIVNLALASKDKAAFIKAKNPVEVPSAEFTYTQSQFQAGLTVKTAGFAPVAQADVSASFNVWDKISAGGSFALTYDNTAAEKSFSGVTDVQVGAQYSQPDLTISLYSNKSDDKPNPRQANLSYFQKISSDISATAIVTVDVDSANKDLSGAVGGEVKIDVDTVVRGKIEINPAKKKEKATINVEHRLASPAALVGITSEFDVSNIQEPKAGKFGITFTFGDF